MFKSGNTLARATVSVAEASNVTVTLGRMFNSSPYHMPTFRRAKTSSKAALEIRAQRMEGSSFSAEQFARTRKPFDVPVTTKLPLEERRPSAAKLLSTLAQNEVSSLKKLPRELARFDVGDRIAVTQLLSLHEDKLQTIKGVVVSKRRREYLNASFTILNVIDGVKAEVLIPLYSPFIRKIEVIDRLKERGFKTTQRKLYHFRNLANTDRRVKALL